AEHREGPSAEQQQPQGGGSDELGCSGGGTEQPEQAAEPEARGGAELPGEAAEPAEVGAECAPAAPRAAGRGQGSPGAAGEAARASDCSSPGALAARTPQSSSPRGAGEVRAARGGGEGGGAGPPLLSEAWPWPHPEPPRPGPARPSRPVPGAAPCAGSEATAWSEELAAAHAASLGLACLPREEGLQCLLQQVFSWAPLPTAWSARRGPDGLLFQNRVTGEASRAHPLEPFLGQLA
ncbi:unnamed protein product, partial [Prorocentrum cordatum]